MLWNCGSGHGNNIIPCFIYKIKDYKALCTTKSVLEKGLRQVIMALILWATDVPHNPKQREAKMWI